MSPAVRRPLVIDSSRLMGSLLRVGRYTSRYNGAVPKRWATSRDLCAHVRPSVGFPGHITVTRLFRPDRFAPAQLPRGASPVRSSKTLGEQSGSTQDHLP